MEETRYDRIKILNIIRQGVGAILNLVEGLLEKIREKDKIIEEQAEKIKGLESRIKKDSHNSSKPPRSDQTRKIKSMRVKSEKKSGGQKGHKGKTLNLSETPDKIERIEIKECSCCKKDIRKEQLLDIERRQVYEIPKVKIQVTEYQSEIKKCSNCGKMNRGKFPEEVSNVVQYGDRIKSFSMYLMHYQLIPWERTVEIIEDIFSHRISEGTLNNVSKNCYELLEKTEERIRAELLIHTILHGDETGMYVAKQQCYLHVICGEDITYYAIHEKRGREAINSIGIIPRYKGKFMHDYFQSYFEYLCVHLLCNAHHLRDLVFVLEEEKQIWAKSMIALLLEIKEEVENKKLKGKSSFEKEEIERYENRFDKVISTGFKENNMVDKKERPKKRIKQSKGGNLLDRFKKHKKETLGYMYDFEAPFDNNLAERDLRMMKVKQNISGCFRSFEAAKYFCRIRSYISTIRKRGLKPLDALVSVFERNPIFESVN
jgi:transposase